MENDDLYKLNSADIISHIRMAAYECSDPRTDGFTGWGIKQDLYQIKWALDEALRRCPKYSVEDEWLEKQQQAQVIKILKNAGVNK